MGLYSKVTDLPREGLGERRSGLGRVCDVFLLGFYFRGCTKCRNITFLITVYFCSLLLQQAMENSMGAGDEREGNEQGAKKRTKKYKIKTKQLGKGAQILYHILQRNTSIKKKPVKSLCGKRIAKDGMISKLADHILLSIQPQLAHVLENRSQYTLALMPVRKKEALWPLPNTEINRGNGDICVFFMSLPQTLYDIKYVKQMTSYLTSPCGVLGALNYSGL